MNNLIKHQKTIIRLSACIILVYFLYTLGMVIFENEMSTVLNPIPDISIISKYFGL